MTDQESALLVGGPASGLRVTVTGRPRMLLVTYPCAVDPDCLEVRGEVKVDAVHVYRLDPHPADGPPRYGYDPASP
ncbi:hypothetical protein ACIRSU_05920 [Streptomyces sp. NPDC101160]|uniref:hypothetical protein n=1 Tax=Streptomyces sp. NPDC101160 TaxID=3366118 RepID=UPI00381C3128